MNTFKTSWGIGLLVGLASFVHAVEQTWTGKISDSICGDNHAKMMAEHKDAKTDRDYTLVCVKGGGKYVLVSSGKVYNIENQKIALLQEHAGHTVQLTGEMKGDAITVSKIVMEGKK